MAGSDAGGRDSALANGRQSAAGVCVSNSFEHDPGPRRDAQRRALIGALGLKTVLFALEVTGGIAFGSLALLADAADRVSDVIALGVAIAAVVLAARPVTSRHSFGFARVEVMAAQVTSLMMLVAGLWIVTEALARLRDPVPVDGAGLAVVAALGLVFNGASAALVRRDQGQSLNMRACFAHLATDAAGSLAALIAGMTILAWGWTRADAVASLSTAILILWAASRLLRESIHVFMEAAPRGLDPQQVQAVIRGVDGVVDVHHLHLWSLASDVPACSAHVVLANRPTLAEAQRSGMAIKAALVDQLTLTNVTLELEDTPQPQAPQTAGVDSVSTSPHESTGRVGQLDIRGCPLPPRRCQGRSGVGRQPNHSPCSHSATDVTTSTMNDRRSSWAVGLLSAHRKPQCGLRCGLAGPPDCIVAGQKPKCG